MALWLPSWYRVAPQERPRTMVVNIRILDRDRTGFVDLDAQVEEDLWTIFQLIVPGDRLSSDTMRKITMDNGSASRRHVRLTIEVASVDYTPGEQVVRVSGRVAEEHDHVRMGSYHTIDLELNRRFRLTKPFWDDIHLDRLEAAGEATQADVAAVVLSQSSAVLMSVSGQMTVVRARIDWSIPKKRIGSSGHAKAVQAFHEAVFQAVLKHVDFSVVKCCLIAGPAYTKDDFFKFMIARAEALQTQDAAAKAILLNRSKFLLCSSSAGSHKRVLAEVLMDPSVQTALATTKAAAEVRAVNQFFVALHRTPEKAFYGFKHCKLAVSLHAVEELLVTDELFRSANIATRREYIQLVKDAQENGAIVHILSVQHVSGERLQQIGGVAARLRNPLGLEPEDMKQVDREDDMDSDPDYDSDDTVGATDVEQYAAAAAAAATAAATAPEPATSGGASGGAAS